ncbi:hypothetical protein LSH36_74g14039 [Paralvinella palmiformis]|uniref:G-protein coupled receptors family 1 profile domain-containing protein n=1 Tax=Paralvinella palmiformis TaxID=53620 RepID=A0AAD9NBD3_9ANNE|nr:hypothetical protein LSH36_74g14039 [Paralvinella palmiformis]
MSDNPIIDEALIEFLYNLEHMPIGVRACGLIMGSFCTLSSLFGNLLIAIIFLLDKGLRQRQNTFVVSAAIMEVMTIFLRDIFLLAVYRTGKWQFGTALLYINCLFFYSRNGFAIGHVIALTVYRYAMIVRPNAYRVLSRTPVMLLALVLVFLIPLCGALLVLSGKLVFNTKVMFPVTEKALGIQDNRLVGSVSRNWIAGLFLYIIGNAMILVGCNVHIYFFIKKSSRRVGCITPKGMKKANETKVSKRSPSKEARFVKIMTIMFSMFLVCYFPIPIAMTTDPKWDLSHWIYLPLLLINWFSSSVSWVIYIITHTAFRIAVLKRIKCSPVIEFEDSTSHTTEDHKQYF